MRVVNALSPLSPLSPLFGDTLKNNFQKVMQYSENYDELHANIRTNSQGHF